MDVQEVKRQLQEARNIDRRIEATRERIERMRARLMAGKRFDYEDKPRGGSRGDWTEAADQIMELEARLVGQLAEMSTVLSNAARLIEGVPDVRYRELLELYYLDGLTWPQVAVKMEIANIRQVYRMHGRALLAAAQKNFFDREGTKEHKRAQKGTNDT